MPRFDLMTTMAIVLLTLFLESGSFTVVVPIELSEEKQKQDGEFAMSHVN